MTTNDVPVNTKSAAMLKNVSSCLVLADNLIQRPDGLSGFGVFSGPSGYGKTFAGQKVQNMRGAMYLEVRSWWTKKVLFEMLLQELGVTKPPRTMAGIMMRIIELLSDDRGHLLIIDEADKLVDKTMIEYVRDLQQDTQIPILLIGEELLPQKLKGIERMYNRVLEWELAQPSDLADAKLLAAKWCPGIAIADRLLETIIQKTGGNARKIAATLNKARIFATNSGLKALDPDNYAGGYFTGEPLSRKR